MYIRANIMAIIVYAVIHLFWASSAETKPISDVNDFSKQGDVLKSYDVDQEEIVISFKKNISKSKKVAFLNSRGAQLDGIVEKHLDNADENKLGYLTIKTEMAS